MSRNYILKLTREKGPLSAKQLADEMGINESTVNTCLRRARAHGTRYIRIAAWAGGVALYAPGPDADEPGGSTAVQVLAHLETEGRGSVADIARQLHLTKHAVDAAVRRLHRGKPKKIYIAAWKRRVGERGGRMGAVYAKGDRSDAQKPDATHVQVEAEARRAEKRRVASALRTGKKLRGPMRRRS